MDFKSLEEFYANNPDKVVDLSTEKVCMFNNEKGLWLRIFSDLSDKITIQNPTGEECKLITYYKLDKDSRLTEKINES